MKEKEFLPAVNSKLGIEKLNDMQLKMLQAATQHGDIILLSPTGTGKTLAFLLPLLKLMKEPTGRIQAVVIAPTRELVLQIADTLKALGTGYHIATLYGGHKTEDEINSLKAAPDIIIATPGRLLDQSQRGNALLLPTRIIILDEFDKALELGFEKEMTKLVGRMKNASHKILTSATRMHDMPEFINLRAPFTLSYLDDSSQPRARTRVHKVESDTPDKLHVLFTLLQNITPTGKEKSIIFVNHRESAERIYKELKSAGITPGLYHGALDQHDREKAIAMFNNGTTPILVATDLASRGLDIERVNNIIHYHLPLTEEVYTHRNGRTARVTNEGDVYVLVGPNDDIKQYIECDDETFLTPNDNIIPASGISTIYISGGKREKLSKGDIVGFLTKQAGLKAEEIGAITLRDHYSLVGISSECVKKVLQIGAKEKIKGEKRKFSLAKA